MVDFRVIGREIPGDMGAAIAENLLGDFSISGRLIDSPTTAIRRTARISGGDFRDLNQQLGELVRRLQDDNSPMHEFERDSDEGP